MGEKAYGMGKSRRANKRTTAYRKEKGYSNADTAREAHPIPNPVKFPRPRPAPTPPEIDPTQHIEAYHDENADENSLENQMIREKEQSGEFHTANGFDD